MQASAVVSGGKPSGAGGHKASKSASGDEWQTVSGGGTGAARPPRIAAPAAIDTTEPDTPLGEDEESPTSAGGAAADLPTGEALKRKLLAIVEEYSETEDLTEATTCLEELRGSEEVSSALTRLASSTLDKSAKWRTGIARLLAQGVSLGLVDPADIARELEAIAPTLDDQAVDVPKVAQYFTELVTPCLVSGAVPVAQFAAICGQAKGLAAVSLASAVVALRAAAPEALDSALANVSTGLAAAVSPGKYTAVVNALGASAALFPAMVAVAAHRKALQQHSDVDALLKLHGEVPEGAARSADYASLIVSDICHFAFVALAAEDVGELKLQLAPYARLLLRVVADAEVADPSAAAAVLDSVYAFASADGTKGLTVALFKFLLDSSVVKAAAFEQWIASRESDDTPVSEDVAALRDSLPT